MTDTMGSASAGAQGIRDALDVLRNKGQLREDEDLHVLVLAGDGPYRDAVERLIREHLLEDCVRLLRQRRAQILMYAPIHSGFPRVASWPSQKMPGF